MWDLAFNRINSRFLPPAEIWVKMMNKTVIVIWVSFQQTNIHPYVERNHSSILDEKAFGCVIAVFSRAHFRPMSSGFQHVCMLGVVSLLGHWGIIHQQCLQHIWRMAVTIFLLCFWVETCCDRLILRNVDLSISRFLKKVYLTNTCRASPKPG